MSSLTYRYSRRTLIIFRKAIYAEILWRERLYLATLLTVTVTLMTLPLILRMGHYPTTSVVQAAFGTALCVLQWFRLQKIYRDAQA